MLQKILRISEIALQKQIKKKANQYVAPVILHNQPGWSSISQTPPPLHAIRIHFSFLWLLLYSCSNEQCIFAYEGTTCTSLNLENTQTHTKRKYTNSSLDSWRCVCQNFIGVGCFACWLCTRKLVRCAPKVWRSDENKRKMHDSVIVNFIETKD